MKTKNYYKSQVKFINLRDNNKNLFKSCMYINFTLSKFLDIIGALKFSYFSYKKKNLRVSIVVKLFESYQIVVLVPKF